MAEVLIHARPDNVAIPPRVEDVGRYYQRICDLPLDRSTLCSGSSLANVLEAIESMHVVSVIGNDYNRTRECLSSMIQMPIEPPEASSASASIIILPTQIALVLLRDKPGVMSPFCGVGNMASTCAHAIYISTSAVPNLYMQDSFVLEDCPNFEANSTSKLAVLFPNFHLDENEENIKYLQEKVEVLNLGFGRSSVYLNEKGCDQFLHDLSQSLQQRPGVPGKLILQQLAANIPVWAPLSETAFVRYRGLQLTDGMQAADKAAAYVEAELNKIYLPVFQRDLVTLIKSSQDHGLLLLHDDLHALNMEESSGRNVCVQHFMTRIGRHRTLICKRNVLESHRECMHVANQAFTAAFGNEIIDRRMKWVQEALLTFVNSYAHNPLARGPMKDKVLVEFLRIKASPHAHIARALSGVPLLFSTPKVTPLEPVPLIYHDGELHGAQAPFIEGLVETANIREELSADEIELCRSVQESIEGQHLEDIVALRGLLDAVRHEEEMHAESLHSALSLQLRQAATEVQSALRTATAGLVDDMATSTGAACDSMASDTEGSVYRAQGAVASGAARLQRAADGFDAAQRSSDCLQESINETRMMDGFWDTFGQWLISGASVLAGAALCIWGGPVGAFVGGMLLSAGMSTGMKLAFNKGRALDWADYGKEIGIGLATGAVTGGLGLTAGAVLKGAAVAAQGASIGFKAGVVAAHAATYSAAGATGAIGGTVISNAVHGRPLEEGLGAAAAGGALTGFVSGSIAGYVNLSAAASEAARTGVTAASSSAKEIARTAGVAFSESTVNGGLGGLVSSAFDPNLSAGDGFLQGLACGAAGGVVAACTSSGRALRERAKARKALDVLREEGFLHADNKVNKVNNKYCYEKDGVSIESKHPVDGDPLAGDHMLNRHLDTTASRQSHLDRLQDPAAPGGTNTSSAFRGPDAPKKILDKIAGKVNCDRAAVQNAANEYLRADQMLRDSLQANKGRADTALQDAARAAKDNFNAKRGAFNATKFEATFDADRPAGGTLKEYAKWVFGAADGPPCGGPSWGQVYKLDGGKLMVTSQCPKAKACYNLTQFPQNPSEASKYVPQVKLITAFPIAQDGWRPFAPRAAPPTEAWVPMEHNYRSARREEGAQG